MCRLNKLKLRRHGMKLGLLDRFIELIAHQFTEARSAEVITVITMNIAGVVQNPNSVTSQPPLSDVMPPIIALAVTCNRGRVRKREAKRIESKRV